MFWAAGKPERGRSRKAREEDAVHPGRSPEVGLSGHLPSHQEDATESFPAQRPSDLLWGGVYTPRVEDGPVA